MSREPVKMKSGPLQREVILDDLRRLARSIMRTVLARHRRPHFHRLIPNIDQRHVSFGPAKSASYGDLWISVAALGPLDKKPARRPRRDA